MTSRAAADAATSIIRYTVWDDITGETARQYDQPWPDFVQRLKQAPRKRKKKSAQLVKLATFGDERTAKGSLRHDANVLEIDGVEGDYDGKKVSPETAIALLEEHGIRAVVATTWTHTPEAPRWNFARS